MANRNMTARKKGKKAAADAEVGPLELNMQDPENTAVKIAQVLRRARHDLPEELDSMAHPQVLASAFMALAAEKSAETAEQWQAALAEALIDADDTYLDEEDNDGAVRQVVTDLVKRGLLTPKPSQIDRHDTVLALLEEDGQWYQALVDEVLGDGRFRVIFLQPFFGKPQETSEGDIRVLASIVDDEQDDSNLKEGECDLCRCRLLLTFHHLIPKDTHPTYLGKRWPPGLEGAVRADTGEVIDTSVPPSRHDLNSYGTMVCRKCHAAIHRIDTNGELAKEYNTVEKILKHPDIQRRVEWLRPK